VPLFKDDEKGRASYGRFYAADEHASSLSEVLTGDPLSESYKAPYGDKPRDLVRYLIACQKRTYDTTICEQGTVNEGALLRSAGSLLKKYHPELIKRAIKLATIWSPYTFSFKYVRERTIPEIIKRFPE
jgi:hypothetical protein